MIFPLLLGCRLLGADAKNPELVVEFLGDRKCGAATISQQETEVSTRSQPCDATLTFVTSDGRDMKPLVWPSQGWGSGDYVLDRTPAARRIELRRFKELDNTAWSATLNTELTPFRRLYRDPLVHPWWNPYLVLVDLRKAGRDATNSLPLNLTQRDPKSLPELWCNNEYAQDVPNLHIPVSFKVVEDPSAAERRSAPRGGSLAVETPFCSSQNANVVGLIIDRGGEPGPDTKPAYDIWVAFEGKGWSRYTIRTLPYENYTVLRLTKREADL